jgi:hypothetical protein
MFSKLASLSALVLLAASCGSADAPPGSGGGQGGTGGAATGPVTDASAAPADGAGGSAGGPQDASTDPADAAPAGTGGNAAGGTAGTVGQAGAGGAETGGTEGADAGGVDAESPADSAPIADSGATADAGPAATTWTILVYGHGDNTLSNSLFQDMVEMASATLNDKVNVVLLADWDASQTIPGTAEHFPTGSQWYTFAGGGVAPKLVASSAELDFDDPAVLSAAIEYAYTKYPANHRGLVLWDHGGSWSAGFGGDTQDGTRVGGGLSAEAVASAVRSGLTAAGISGTRPLEFFSYDTCLMAGAEVTATVKDLAKTYLANAEIDYGAGWDYGATLTWIAQHPDAAPRDLAAAEVKAWDAHHATSTTSDVLLRSHVAIDLTKFDAFATASRSFVDAVENQPAAAAEVSRAFAVSLPGYWTEFASPRPAQLRDVGQLFRSLEARAGGTVATTASQVLASLGAMRIAGSLGSYRVAQDGFHIFAAPIMTIAGGVFTRYAALAPSWNGASDWSAGLQAVQSHADAVAPVIAGAGTVPVDPGPGNLPRVDFTIGDSDLLYAEAELAQQHPTVPNAFIMYGFLAAAFLNPGDGTLTWGGALLTIPTTTSNLIVTARPWGIASTPTGLAYPLLAVPGQLTVLGDRLPCTLLVDRSTLTATDVLLGEGTRLSTFSLSALRAADPSAAFVPLVDVYDGATDLYSQVPLPTGVFIPASGTLVFSYQAAVPGSYIALLSGQDVWGNVGWKGFALDLTTPVRQP